MKCKVVAAVCSTALFLSACATQKDIELNQTNLTTVHRIAIVGPVDPVSIAVATESEASAQKAMMAVAAIPLFGVLGAAIAGGAAGAISSEIAKETSEPLAKLVEKENYKLGAEMRSSLLDALKQDGYDVSEVSLPGQQSNKFPDNYNTIKDQADVIVDARGSAVCSNIDSGSKSHFRPVVSMYVRVFRTSDNSTLMQKGFVLDDATAKPDQSHVKGDTKFDVPDYASLKADVGVCLEGVRAALPVLTQSIAASLSRSSQTAPASK